MLNTTTISIFVGAVLGILAGLGVGGGSLLILWLTVVLGMEQSEARTVNLLFFVPCALTATVYRWRHGTVDVKKLLPAIAAGCIFTGIGTWISSSIELQLLKKLFGVLLLVTGIRELFYRERNAR